MPLILLNNWKPLLAILIAALFGLGCYQEGRKAVKAQWDATNAQAALKVHDTEILNTKTAYEIGIGYERSRIDIDSNFNGYINGLYATSADLSDKSNSARKPDGSACTNRISQATKRRVLELGREAELNTQKLIALQKWVDGRK